MKKLTSTKQIIAYAFGGFGVNLINLIIGAYLCDALMTDGFKVNIENWTYLNVTLVNAAVWSVFVFMAKIIDGIIDIPLAGFTDNLRTRFGKRRPSIIMGFIPMIVMFILFLLPINNTESIANTVWFGLILCCYYVFYTLTMVTYYATFAEIVDNEKDRLKLSNTKSVFDIVYFILGYALIPVLVGVFNIRIIALIFLPIALTMLIPIFLIKEKNNKIEFEVYSRNGVEMPNINEQRKALNNEFFDENGNFITKVENVELVEKNSGILTKTREARYDEYYSRCVALDDEEERLKKEFKNNDGNVGLFESIKITFKDKDFLLWMLVFAFMTFGIQLFLAAMNVYYSGAMEFSGVYITISMACSFSFFPLGIFIYNKLVKKKGFRFGFLYCLLTFSIAMTFIFFGNTTFFPGSDNFIIRLVFSIIGGIIASFSISTFFSVGYLVPSQLASNSAKKTGKQNSAMYFAVQGLVSGVFTGVATGIVWIQLKDHNLINIMPLFVIGGMAIAFGLSFFLPKSIDNIGLVENSKKEVE